MAVAFIPARAGSKGIPRKNLVDFCGKPLVAWSILQARAADCIERVVVSSDSHEIGSVAKQYGAEWVQRPVELAGDTAPTETAIAHWLDQESPRPEVVVMLQPTSPLRHTSDIDGAYRKYLQSDADSLFTARRVEGFTWDVNGHIAARYDYGQRKRRQELNTHTIEENGSIYIFQSRSFMVHANRLGGRIAWYEMHPLDSFQIDTPADLQMLAELFPLRMRHAMDWAA